MTEPTDIADARRDRDAERDRAVAPARVAVVLPVAGTPGTGALVTGARARLRHAAQTRPRRLAA